MKPASVGLVTPGCVVLAAAFGGLFGWASSTGGEAAADWTLNYIDGQQ